VIDHFRFGTFCPAEFRLWQRKERFMKRRVYSRIQKGQILFGAFMDLGDV
jgi:hypothetical protein